jgi:hypothetical protein
VYRLAKCRDLSVRTQRVRFPWSKKKGVQTLALVCLLVCSILNTGCSYPRYAWQYRTNNYPRTTQPAIHKTVVVSPFKDTRSNENRSKFFGMPMLLIPFVPYGWADYARPESRGTVKLQDVFEGYDAVFHRNRLISWQFRPDKDCAEAFAEELNESGLFKDVMLSERGSDGDLIFRGELKSTNYKAEVYTYGLSMAFLLPGFAGAPIGHVYNELVVDLTLEERTTGTVLWHKSYHETKEATYFAYWMPPDFYYDRLFALVMQDVVKSLQAELSALPSGATENGPTSSRGSLSN